MAKTFKTHGRSYTTSYLPKDESTNDTHSPNPRILLLGANYRAMFYVARKLYLSKYHVDVIDWEEIPIERSKYIHKYYRVADSSVSSMINAIEDIISAHNYEALIPINDVGLLLCKSFYDKISAFVPILMSNLNSLKFAYDKYELYKQSLFCEFGDNNSILVQNKDALIRELQKNNGQTVVVKSCSSKKIVAGKIESYSVFKSDSLQDIVERFSNEYEYPLIIQNNIKGKEFGFNFLAINGKIKAYYIDEFHHGSFGTECVSRKSSADNPILYNKIRKLIDVIGWNGVGMFDIIENGNNFYIIELNGRFWASIDLSDKVISGIWEAYETIFLDQKNFSAIYRYKDSKCVFINIQSSLKKLLHDFVHPNRWIDNLSLVVDIVKTCCSKHYFIQEHLWDDRRFYLYLLMYNLKRL